MSTSFAASIAICVVQVLTKLLTVRVLYGLGQMLYAALAHLLLFVYGMLRPGNRLFKLFNPARDSYLSTARLGGFRLTTQGGLVFMVPSNNMEDCVVGDIIRISPYTEEVLNIIEDGYTLTYIPTLRLWYYKAPAIATTFPPIVKAPSGNYNYTKDIQDQLLRKVN